MRKMHKYSAEQLAWIKANQAPISRQQLTELFNAKFNASVSCNALSLLCVRKEWSSRAIAWNKGMPAQGVCFQKDHKVRSKPVGYECLRSNGEFYVKVAEPNIYKRKKFVVWERHYGQRPNNHDIRFLDNDKTNCTIDNLICVPRAIAINTNVHNPADTDRPELNRAIYLNETLKHKLKERL